MNDNRKNSHIFVLESKNHLEKGQSEKEKQKLYAKPGNQLLGWGRGLLWDAIASLEVKLLVTHTVTHIPNQCKCDI